MESALLDDEQQPDAIDGIDNAACDSKEEGVEGLGMGLTRREGTRLPRAGSEGDLLSPRLGYELPAWSTLTRRPSLSGLSSPIGETSLAGEEVAWGRNGGDLNGQGSSQVGGIYHDQGAPDVGRSQRTSSGQHLSIVALLHTYNSMGFGEGNRSVAMEWSVGGIPIRKDGQETEPIATDIAAISLDTGSQEKAQKPKKSILDGCGKCGKIKWNSSRHGLTGTHSEPELAVCMCKSEDTVLTIADDIELPITTTKPESSVATKVQKVLDRMQSAFVSS